VKGVVAAVAALVLVPCAWMAAASAILCAVTSHMSLYRFPFLQWAEAAPWWRFTWWMTLSVAVSATIPTVVVLLLAYGVVSSLYRRGRQPAIYGQTGWAERGEMQRGGIRSERSPF
jgi:hypothetical protein